MFSSLIGPLSFAVVLAAIVMVAAALAEGRGRHLSQLVQRLRSHRDVENVVKEVIADVPRPEGDWDLVAEVNSTPDRPAPGERALVWAVDAGTKASRAVSERASALGHGEQATESAPRSGELGLARQ